MAVNMRIFIAFCVFTGTLARLEPLVESSPVERCPENQHYNPCGTACPLTCDIPFDSPRICALVCVPGCHCDKGYVKAKNGQCVRPEKCNESRKQQPEKEHECFSRPDPGICRAYFRRWFYDAESGSCQPFVYGGCRGNGNRYESQKKCMDHCKDVRPKQLSNDMCDLPAETGHCNAYLPRIYYEKVTGQCRKFIYGGCGGNMNNFRSVQECQQTCQRNRRRSLQST